MKELHITEFRAHSRDDEQSPFNFVISFLNSSGEDANKYAEENKNRPEFCYPEKSSLNITVYFLPFIFLPVGLDWNRFKSGFTMLASWRGVADIFNDALTPPAQCTLSYASVPLMSSRQQTSVEPV